MNFGAIPSGFDSVIEGAAASFVIYWLEASSCSFIAEIRAAIFADTRIFWTSALAKCLDNTRLTKDPKATECHDTVVAARNAAMEATGDLASYADGIPGVGPTQYVPAKEGWQATGWASAILAGS